MQSDIASTSKIAKAEAAQEFALLSSSLTAKADAAEKEAQLALEKQRTTIQAERAVTSHTIASMKANHQAALLLREKDSEEILEHNKHLRSSTHTEIVQLRESLSEQEVQSKSAQRDIKKGLNKIIGEKNKMLKTSTNEVTTADQETKRLTKRQKMLEATAETASVQRDVLVIVKATMQTELDAALLSVGALRTESKDLQNQVLQLEHDCAEAVVEIEVSLYV